MRSFLLAVSVLCVTIVVSWLSTRGGVSYINLDNFLREPLRFSMLLVMPALVAAGCLMAATLPRVITVNLAVGICLIGLLDTGARLLAPKAPAVRGEPEALGGSAFYLPDPTLGYVMAPGTVARHRRTIGGTQIYDVIYRTDDRGRRDTPAGAGPLRTSFVLWFGDSNVFGEGVSQTETLPYYTSESAPDYRSYNYGVSGYGPSNVLALARRGGFRGEVTEREGYAVVFLIPAHVARVVGSSTVSTGWGRHFPYYVEGPRGEVLRAGDFVHGRPFLTLGYSLWARSGLAEYLGVDLPIRYTEDDYRLTAKVLKEASRLLAQQLDLRGFVVILSQAYNDAQRRVIEGVREALAEEGVPYLDYTGLFDTGDVRYRLAELDFHNSAAANRVIAEWLVADLLHAR
ncbi:MAG: hypothetical protein H0T50_06855 [Gemmatimonadales bacterium]|nr:hypothetical protein [Gemmatimonadales bacterium]